MISVKEAKKIISNNITLLSEKRLPLIESNGKLLREDIYSPIDLPPFNQSSVDGYAFCFDEWKKANKLTIEGEVQAGNTSNTVITNHTAVRIFTGAPIPFGTDTVVMQEKTTEENGILNIDDNTIQKGSNARIKGAELKKGSLAVRKDTLINAASIAFLAGMGIPEVLAIPNPAVSIIITGNELQQIGDDLTSGKIYDSNSFALTAALHKQKIFDINIIYVKDNLDSISEALKKCIEQSDLILLTGGVSVGEYDFVIRASENCGVKNLFHRIKQRPGKPLFFGKKDNSIIFGLPGNPASVLTCFYEYVLPALEKMTGQIHSLKKINSPIMNEFKKAAGLTHFLKGWYDGKVVRILEGQESYKLSSFAQANCLVIIDEDETESTEGDMVELHLLP
ncbi:MAG: molybdopterin molybdotransferase MoeA [Ferruginibacter sp.]|nr:molybdopterin molybdotransferase MoeA [Ferruginibacter sp.]